MSKRCWKGRLACFSLAAFLSSAGPTLAATLYVPSQYATIQAAINAAQPGDVVELADETYTGAGNKDLRFYGKAITVRSASGDPALCVINCEGDGKGVRFEFGEGPSSIIRGVTIANARGADYGPDAFSAAVSCRADSSPTLIDCRMIGGWAGGSGAGIGVGDIDGMDISHPTLINCTLGAGYADICGGGVSCLSGAVTLINCTISGNYGLWGGGGVYAGYGDVTLINCTVADNSTGEQGYGGGIASDGENSEVLIVNCTIADNTAGDFGGVVSFRATASNCIIWGNVPDQIGTFDAPAAASYCDVQGGWPGTGNVDSDPMFIDPDGPDNDPNTCEDNDYRLSAGSPCIDAGDNAAVPVDTWDLDSDGNTIERVPIDLAGLLRFVDDPNTPDTGAGTPPIVDMGAYEYSPDCNNNGVYDGEDITSGASEDCNGNWIPDECEPQADCNGNGIQDICDIGVGFSQDCQPDGVPDECQLAANDCNGNGVPDSCDIFTGMSPDCNSNDVPDECEAYAGPVIGGQPENQTRCVGQSVTFSVTATGMAPLSYQWRKNGGNISGAWSSSYTIGAVGTADAGSYDCVVANTCGSATSNAATLVVGVSITEQPQSQTPCLRQSVTFSVTANGVGPLSYQWRKNGADIGGATSALYTITSVTSGDVGWYGCIVAGSCGVASSQTAALTISTSTGPSIDEQPQSQARCVAQSVTFSVTAGGTGPLSYQWRKNGSNIGGATDASYTIASPIPDDTGSYDCAVTDDCGSITSSAAALIVSAAPWITEQPEDQARCVGQSVTFSVTAAGTGPLSYQWRKNSTDILGATSASYTINSATLGDAGNYDCVVTDECGLVTSDASTLTVNAVPAITEDPESQTRCTGQSVTFSVTAGERR